MIDAFHRYIDSAVPILTYAGIGTILLRERMLARRPLADPRVPGEHLFNAMMAVVILVCLVAWGFVSGTITHGASP